MSLPHILLGLLSTPQSGYDLKKEFDLSLRNFWSAELSQIYPALQKLEKQKFLKSKKSESDIGPTRRVYQRTKAGQRELVRWLDEGPVVGKERIEYLSQTYFLAELRDRAEAVKFLTNLQGYLQDRLEMLLAIEQGWKQKDPRYPDELEDNDFYPQLTLDLGLRRMRATLDWCENALARIDRRPG